MSIDIFDRLFTQNEHLIMDFDAYGVFEEDRQLIKDLIHLDIFKSPTPEQAKMTYEQKVFDIYTCSELGLNILTFVCF